VVNYIPETLRITTAGQWQIGQRLHIEAPATLRTPLSGWLVSGHVDTTAVVLNVQTGTNYAITVQLPAASAALVMVKGGVTVNGVNLTVTAVTTDSFTVQLVPYTLTHTTLGDLTGGERVNVEFDYIAKLAQRYWSTVQA
jgi:riboflavin synthase